MTKYFSILILLVFFSCVKDNATFDIGGKYVDVQTNLIFVDTFSVRSYTVRFDSLRTSGLGEGEGAITVGQYEDPEMGTITSSSYFKVTLPGVRSLPANAIYDSLSLILVDNNYSIGDTLVPITLKVHRLSQAIKSREDGYLYSTSKVSYDPEVLGTVTFKPRPNRRDTMSIGLDDALGAELFALLKEKDDRLTDNINFQNYFKGLTLQPDSTDNAILGYKTAFNSPLMRLYFHYQDFDVVKAYRDFTIFDYITMQFNNYHISHPKFEIPPTQADKIPASQSGHQTYLQAGTGILTRLEFPYLKNLLQLYQNVKVLKAELIIEPMRNTYKTIQLPEKVSIYSTDDINRFGSPILNVNTGAVLTGNLKIDEVYQEETSYTFDVTNFIASKLTEATDEIPAILITIAPNDVYRTTKRLVLGSQQNSSNEVKLKVYYMHY